MYNFKIYTEQVINGLVGVDLYPTLLINGLAYTIINKQINHKLQSKPVLWVQI